MMEVIIFLVSIFFVVNMGAPSFAGSFSTAAGSGALSRVKSQVLFLVFAALGAGMFGQAVTKTLGQGIVPPGILSINAVLIILVAATLSLFSANLMHIPQSTSLSTMAAICGVGLFHGSIAWEKIQYLVACWIISTVVSFALIYIVAHFIYPPRRMNFWIYERFVHHTERLKKIVIVTSCYKAFAQGTNNVANAVGPLSAAGLIGAGPGLILLGIVFGLGAMTFSGPLKTSSEKIVPLGLLTATVINLVSGTITIVASKLGVPLPTVIVYTVAIFAIGSIKDGVQATINNPVTRKTFFTWCINPILTLWISFILAKVFLTSP